MKRRKVTRTPQPLAESPPKLFLLRRWAALMRARYDAPVYLFGSAVRGATNPRDYDVCVVLTERQFAERYASPHMLKTMSVREIVAQWQAEDLGEAREGGMYSRWMRDQRKMLKDAFHKHTGLIIDFHVQPLSSWRGYRNIQFWRLA